MTSEHDETHHVHYGLIFATLCLLTGLSIISDIVHIESKALVVVIVMAIAVAKASFVALFFMHLKFERNWKYVLLGPTTILAIGLPLALLPDISIHYYRIDVPQTQVTAQAEAGSTPAHSEGSHHE